MGPKRYAARVGELIGYAGCSTVPQDLAAQREALAALGESKAIARARGRLKGLRPKLPARQQAELRRMHGTGGYTMAELMGVFSAGRATVYGVLGRDIGGSAATAGVDTA